MKKTTIKIEKGIPIPTHGNDNGFSSVVKGLKVGESFIVKKENRGACLNASYRFGMKAVTRAISATECRVWRTA